MRSLILILVLLVFSSIVTAEDLPCFAGKSYNGFFDNKNECYSGDISITFDINGNETDFSFGCEPVSIIAHDNIFKGKWDCTGDGTDRTIVQLNLKFSECKNSCQRATGVLKWIEEVEDDNGNTSYILHKANIVLYLQEDN